MTLELVASFCKEGNCLMVLTLRRSPCDAEMYHMKKASVRDLRYGFKKIERLLDQGEEVRPAAIRPNN
jgi:hypothetical protein